MSEFRECDYCGRKITAGYFYQIQRHAAGYGTVTTGSLGERPEWPKDACGDCWDDPTAKPEAAA